MSSARASETQESPTDDAIARLTGRVRSLLSAPCPVAALATLGVSVHLHERTLTRRGVILHGAWDPVLQRIELFGVARRSAADLVQTFVHEVVHALAESDDLASPAEPTASRTPDDAAAEKLARHVTAAVMRDMMDANIAALGVRLRRADATSRGGSWA